jgi:hypothetical protein
MKNLYKEVKNIYNEVESLLDNETKKYLATPYIASEIHNHQEYKINWFFIFIVIFALLAIGLIFYII